MEQGRSSSGNKKGREESRTQEEVGKKNSKWKKLCKLMKDRWIPMLHTNVEGNYFLFLILYKGSSYPELD